MNSKQKFLVIQTAFIGDVVLATGIIEKIHAVYPDAQIDFLVRKGNEGLLKDHPFLHEVLVWNKQQNKLKNLWQMLQQIRSNKYNTIINVQRFAATGMLTAFSGAPEKIGFDKNPLSFLFTKRIKHVISSSKNPLHEIERNHALIASFAAGEPARPKLYPSESDYKSVEKYKLQEYVCIAPASVWFTKQYPADKWIAFINKLPDNYQIHLLGAPSDKEMCAGIIAACPGKTITNLSGQLNFLQSAALMQGAAMNFVNDSAPMHFASSVNAPVTAVYCSTLPDFGFGPLSDQSFVVETKELLACRPCGLHGRKTCPLGHFHCAYGIKEKQLLKTLPA
jgi:heptosyltransferase-2